MVWQLPRITAYRTLPIAKIYQPFDTGNWRHNGVYLGTINPIDGSYSIIIDNEKIDYMDDVLQYYKEKKGDDVLHTTTFKVYEFLNSALNGGRPQYDSNYMSALNGSLYSSGEMIRREAREERLSQMKTDYGPQEYEVQKY